MSSQSNKNKSRKKSGSRSGRDPLPYEDDQPSIPEESYAGTGQTYQPSIPGQPYATTGQDYNPVSAPVDQLSRGFSGLSMGGLAPSANPPVPYRISSYPSAGAVDDAYTYAPLRNGSTAPSASIPSYYGTGQGPPTASSGSGTPLSNFQVRDRKFFANPGRVFVIMWAEPAAASAVKNDASTAHINKGARGSYVFQKERYFVVIKALEQHCLALAVHTHGGKGVASVRYKHHYSIIHTGKTAPRPQESEKARRGEEPMQSEPLRVLQDVNADILDPMSRLNYSKIYTIEYRMPVKAFGLIADPSKPVLVEQLRQVHGSDLGTQLGNATKAAEQQTQRATTSGAEQQIQRATTSGADSASTPRSVPSRPAQPGPGNAPFDADQIRALHARLMTERDLSYEDATEVIRKILQKQRELNSPDNVQG